MISIPFSQSEPLIMADKQTRTNLTIADKVKILDRLKNGDKKEDIMKDYKIVQRTLQRIAKSEKEIRQDAISMKSTKKKKTSRSLQGCRHSDGEMVYSSTAERP